MITAILLPMLVGAVFLLILGGCTYLWARHPEIVMIILFIIFILTVSWLFGIVIIALFMDLFC